MDQSFQLLNIITIINLLLLLAGSGVLIYRDSNRLLGIGLLLSSLLSAVSYILFAFKEYLVRFELPLDTIEMAVYPLNRLNVYVFFTLLLFLTITRNGIVSRKILSVSLVITGILILIPFVINLIPHIPFSLFRILSLGGSISFCTGCFYQSDPGDSGRDNNSSSARYG